MNPPFFVEILTRNKEVKFRHQVNSLPIRIGRGYDNDVILDDPNISAHHALIDETADGRLVIQDLGSHNGIIYKGMRQTEITVEGNMILRLGQTSIRVRSADFPVAAEITDAAFYKWEGWLPAMTGLILILLLTVLSTWINDNKKFEAIRYLTMVALILSIGLVWCGGWSFANRLFGGSARFGRHLFILGCGFAVIETLSSLNDALAYAFSLEIFTRYGSHIIIAICAATIFFHLLTINPLRSRHFVLISIMLAVLGSGLMLMNNYSSTGQLADELYMSQQFPPILRQSSNKPVNQLISEAKKLKISVDEERAKSASAEEDDAEDKD